MRSRIPSLSLAAVLTCCVAPAQTFVVSSGGGPGVDFLEISAAVAAVPDGATLVVWSGTYQPFTVSGKSLNILSETFPATVVDGEVVIENLAVTQSVWMRGLLIDAWPPAPPTTPPVAITIRNCSGLVHLHDVDSIGPITELIWGLEVHDSTQVSLAGCSLRRTALRTSTVTISGSTIVGWGSTGRVTARTSPGLLIDNSLVWLVDGLAYGGDGDLALPSPTSNQPAVEMTQGDLRVLGASTLYEGNAPAGGPPAYEVTGTGSVVYNSRFAQSQPAAPSISLLADGQPGLTIGRTGRPSSPNLAIRGTIPAFRPALLLIGLRDTPNVSSQLPDPLWFAPGAGQVVVGGGGFGINYNLDIPLPSQPVLLGVQIAAHLVVLDATASLRASNPAVHVFR